MTVTCWTPGGYNILFKKHKQIGSSPIWIDFNYCCCTSRLCWIGSSQHWSRLGLGGSQPLQGYRTCWELTYPIRHVWRWSCSELPVNGGLWMRYLDFFAQIGKKGKVCTFWHQKPVWHPKSTKNHSWQSFIGMTMDPLQKNYLVVSTNLKNISQIGIISPIFGLNINNIWVATTQKFIKLVDLGTHNIKLFRLFLVPCWFVNSI